MRAITNWQRHSLLLPVTQQIAIELVQLTLCVWLNYFISQRDRTAMIFSPIIQYFTPYQAQELAVSEFYRGQVLISASLCAIVFITPFVVIRGITDGLGSPGFYIVAISVLVLISTLYLYKYTCSAAMPGFYLTLSSSFVIMAYSFFDGGLHSTSIIWSPILPLFSVFLAGTIYGVAIWTILFLYLTFLVYAHSIDIVPATTFESGQLEFLLFLSTTAVLTILLILAFLYTSWQKAVQHEILTASRAKSEFLSGISHELRNPLNSIIGFSEALASGYYGELNEMQVRHIGYINTSGDHLLALVDNLLDISKIEEGKVEFDPVPVDLHDMIESSLQLVGNTVKEKNIELECKASGELDGLWVYLDESKFRQILINLVSNAIKFTPSHGKVKLLADIEDRNLVVRVYDSGPGIPPEYRQLIFERFFQIHQKTDRKDPGSGLGLAISLHLARLHGGRIYLEEPRQNSGSCFVIEVPLRAALKPGSTMDN